MNPKPDEMTRHATLWLVEWQEVWRDRGGEVYHRQIHEEHIVATCYNALIDFLTNRCSYWTLKAESDFERSLIVEETDPLLEKARQNATAPGICRLGEISLLKKMFTVVMS